MTAKTKTGLVMVGALAGMVLAATGVMDRALSRIGLGELARANHHYLEESYDGALEGFMVLSAVKSGLAVIEGSEVGIASTCRWGTWSNRFTTMWILPGRRCWPAERSCS